MSRRKIQDDSDEDFLEDVNPFDLLGEGWHTSEDEEDEEARLYAQIRRAWIYMDVLCVGDWGGRMKGFLGYAWDGSRVNDWEEEELSLRDHVLLVMDSMRAERARCATP